MNNCADCNTPLVTVGNRRRCPTCDHWLGRVPPADTVPSMCEACEYMDVDDGAIRCRARRCVMGGDDA